MKRVLFSLFLLAGTGCGLYGPILSATCGDGITQQPAEECDDGNLINGDGCQSNCFLPICGDGIIDDEEECDDENQVAGDGCNDDCQLTTIIQVATGGEHTCILTNAGTVKCWGNGSFGRLGYGNVDNIGDNETPANPNVGNVNLGGTATQITAGAEHTCALLTGGNVVCWGNGTSGRLGYSDLSLFGENVGDDETPSDAGIVNVGGDVQQIAAGGAHTCALLVGSVVRCWGEGDVGRLGYGNTNDIGDDEEPASAGDVDLGGVAVQIATGGNHSCAVLDNGALRCWGDGAGGRLGYGNQISIGDNELPSDAGSVPAGANPVNVVLGSSHTCINDTNQSARCWGFGDAGRLGYTNQNNIGDNETPVSIGGPSLGGLLVDAIVAGGAHTCALFSAGNVRCWGDAAQGQLGTGNNTDLGDNNGETPGQLADILLGSPATQIAAGGTHNCALLNTGKLRCWGGNGFGQLGYGNVANLGDNVGETPASGGDVDVFPND
jgi:cysteine-rich repeat protein